MAKIKSKAIRNRNWLKVANVSSKSLSYLSPFIPAVTMTAINWKEWFVESKNGVVVGTGFIMMIISVLLTYLSIAKKKNLLKEFSAFWNVAIIIVCWALSLLFLSSMLSELGYMLLYTGFGVIGAACLDEVDSRLIIPELDIYNSVMEDEGVDKKLQKRQAKVQKIQREIEDAKRRATE